MVWLGSVLLALALVVLGAAFLVWRAKRRVPVCPRCAEPSTFGPDGEEDVCSNCGFDRREEV